MTVDPRLEAELAALAAPSRPPWPARIASLLAIPAAVATLAVLTTWAIGPSTTAAPTMPTATVPAAARAEPRDPPLLATFHTGWVTAAEGLAARFAVDYLTLGTLADGHDTHLAAYLVDSVDGRAGWQRLAPIAAASPLVIDTTVHDARNATVTVAVHATGQHAPRWLHLAVPLTLTDTGHPAVSDLPRLAPPSGSPPAPALPDAADQPMLRAALSPAVLAAVVTYLEAQAATYGFTATAPRVTNIPLVGPGHAVARVEVRVTDAVTGAQLLHAHRVTLRHAPNGRWTVAPLQ